MKKLDDNCFMCSDGVLKVIGNGDQKQLDKNLQCGQCSITVLRSGSVAESDRPVWFIANGKEVKNPLRHIILYRNMVFLKVGLYLWMKVATWMMWLGKRLLQFLRQVSKKCPWVYNLFLFYLFGLFVWRNGLEGGGSSGGGELATLPLLVLASSFLFLYQIMTSRLWGNIQIGKFFAQWMDSSRITIW